MNFYKLLDIEIMSDVYINPKSIEYYIYHEKTVALYLRTKEFMYVDKSDFENMMFLENNKEF